MFGWMSVDRGLVWYSRLLNLALKNMEEEDGPGNFITRKSLFPILFKQIIVDRT